MNSVFKTLIFCAVFCVSSSLFPQENLILENDNLFLEWKNTRRGFRLKKVVVKDENTQISLKNVSGKCSLLYSEKEVSMEPDWKNFGGNVKRFPDSSYFLIYNKWHESLSSVAMNTAGEAIDFFPGKAYKKGDELIFRHSTSHGEVHVVWKLDKQFRNDILVEIGFEAKKEGYYSIATPVLATFKENEMEWGMIPGHFQGRELNDNFPLAYAYGQGIPNRPVVVRERTTTTLSPLIETKEGVTLAVIPEPGTARDPWENDISTHFNWKLGLSLMTRDKKLSPVAYHPVLGQKGSFMQIGEKKIFRFRYTLKNNNWYEVYKHAIYDVYKFSDFLSKKETKKSLINRIWGMFNYVREDSTSLWHTYNYKGLQIGAQEYNAPVVGSNKDAVKNSDYGAMWMLAHLTQDSILLHDRLPYARNFKITQQEDHDEFFRGSASGQYFLWKNKKFTEEWGNYAEPIALTYYIMLDMANALLFYPEDETLRKRLELGAQRLLHWQKPNGSWAVAYNHETAKEMFLDLKDLRPTFYGMLVAYKVLEKKEYLEAAKKGADWFIENATNRGHFLGVCGDFRFAPDFATGQSVQALLDLHEITQDKKYLDAAIATSRIYTASIYTHPIPSNEVKYVNGKPLKDWEISQVGLSFEHGGTMGSASRTQGPILLASHAGMFVRLFKLTGDHLYLDMARASVLGRDAFINKMNHVASYYWRGMDSGPGKFPHHAWWQIGWIMDYLVSEVTLRSQGHIVFPSGFITPKVGPHKTYGFEPGSIYGEQVKLIMKEGLVNVNSPYVDYLVAQNNEQDRTYVMLLNNDNHMRAFQVELQWDLLKSTKDEFSIHLIEPNGERIRKTSLKNNISIKLDAFGFTTLEIIH